MSVIKSINFLRIIALFLFIVPFSGLIGSLLFHNYLVSFKYEYENKYPFKEIKVGASYELTCTQENKWCGNFEQTSKLDQCNKNVVIEKFFTQDGLKEIDKVQGGNLVAIEKTPIITKYEIIDKLEDACILNNKIYSIYKLVPSFFEYVANKEFLLGTSTKVNPILYGETSISNIVKRTPIKYIFKPLMYISAILMILYWFYYNRILNNLIKSDNLNLFFKFGILSALFLVLHVYFLGQNFEMNFLNKLRRSYVVFFILFEVLAQIFLIKFIWKQRNFIQNYLNKIIKYFKLIFVFFVCFGTLLILLVLIFFDLSPKVDYILEWNYFLILLIFYFLSFLIWKKTIQ